MEDVEHMLPQLKKLTRWSGPTLKVKPYLYQRKAIRLAIKERRLGLWMEQGTGKTLVALKVIAYYWKNSLIDDCLILGPKAVLSVWESEAQKFLAIPYTINNPKPGHLNITLINYEVLRKYRKKRKRGNVDMSHMIEKFIGKDCLINLGSGSAADGVVKSVSDGWVELEGKDGNLQAVNIDYISRIRVYPTNKNGKRNAFCLFGQFPCPNGKGRLTGSRPNTQLSLPQRGNLNFTFVV